MLQGDGELTYERAIPQTKLGSCHSATIASLERLGVNLESIRCSIRRTLGTVQRVKSRVRIGTDVVRIQSNFSICQSQITADIKTLPIFVVSFFIFIYSLCVVCILEKDVGLVDA